jgi:hypothetical protein
VLTEWVPVKLAGQTTRFAFSYTVTSDDKATGKVTFRADANIVDHRDALPADNELQSTPISPAAGGPASQPLPAAGTPGRRVARAKPVPPQPPHTRNQVCTKTGMIHWGQAQRL